MGGTSRILRLFLETQGKKSLQCLKTFNLRYFEASQACSMSSARRLHLFHNQGAQERLHELGSAKGDLYPRLDPQGTLLSCRAFVQAFQALPNLEADRQTPVTLHGRVSGLRTAGTRLVFVDITQDGQRLQGVCNLRNLVDAHVSPTEFRESFRRLQKGDTIRLEGIPHRTSTGELSVLLSKLPQIVAPCLPPLPIGLQDKQTRIRNRHVDFLVNPATAELIRIKSSIIQYIRQFLLNGGHIEVQTPILADGAGGAVARSFDTTATEFMSRKIHLRIAPELWLKRMVIGGFDRIFEIGPSFRNEGLDLTHNPEFTTCEFYRTYIDLDGLIAMTEDLFFGLSSHLQYLQGKKTFTLELPDVDFRGPFKRIDFVSGIESAIGRQLPDLGSPSASQVVARILDDCGIQGPGSITLPQMLDRLSAAYLEPQCKRPTFIINHPECLSPLAKSFKHPTTHQMVTARAELFVNSHEIVNTYEEENSPLEQRRKFVDQLAHRGELKDASIDEAYLEALEWGLPPTGGWGGGIERLCMVLTGTTRIGDVLSFGTLRNVVALGRRPEQFSKI